MIDSLRPDICPCTRVAAAEITPTPMAMAASEITLAALADGGRLSVPMSNTISTIPINSPNQHARRQIQPSDRARAHNVRRISMLSRMAADCPLVWSRNGKV